MSKPLHYYLVLDDKTYVPLGLVTSDTKAREKFPNQPFKLVGPVHPNTPIDYDAVDEERYGPFFGNASEYLPDGKHQSGVSVEWEAPPRRLK